MRIRTTLPFALAVALAACQGSPTASPDARPLNSTFVGSGNRDEPAPAGSVYPGGGTLEQQDSASVNSSYMGSGSREGEDSPRSPMIGGGGA